MFSPKSSDISLKKAGLFGMMAPLSLRPFGSLVANRNHAFGNAISQSSGLRQLMFLIVFLIEPL